MKTRFQYVHECRVCGALKPSVGLFMSEKEAAYVGRCSHFHIPCGTKMPMRLLRIEPVQLEATA